MCHLNQKEIKSNWLKIMKKINFQPQHYILSVTTIFTIKEILVFNC